MREFLPDKTKQKLETILLRKENQIWKIISMLFKFIIQLVRQHFAREQSTANRLTWQSSNTYQFIKFSHCLKVLVFLIFYQPFFICWRVFLFLFLSKFFTYSCVDIWCPMMFYGLTRSCKIYYKCWHGVLVEVKSNLELGWPEIIYNCVTIFVKSVHSGLLRIVWRCNHILLQVLGDYISTIKRIPMFGAAIYAGNQVEEE